LDLGLRSFCRRARPDKDQGGINAAVQRAAEKVCAAGRGGSLFDTGRDCRVHSSNGTAKRDARSQRNPNSRCNGCYFRLSEPGCFRFTENATIAKYSAPTKPVTRRVIDCDFRVTEPGRFRVTENASVSKYSAPTKSIARRVTDCCHDRRTGDLGNSAASDFNYAENATFTLDSSANHSHAIALGLRGAHPAARDSSKIGAAGSEHACAGDNSFHRNGTLVEASANHASGKATADPAAHYIADSNSRAGDRRHGGPTSSA
jgi:hypothetical protein